MAQSRADGRQEGEGPSFGTSTGWRSPSQQRNSTCWRSRLAARTQSFSYGTLRFEIWHRSQNLQSKEESNTVSIVAAIVASEKSLHFLRKALGGFDSNLECSRRRALSVSCGAWPTRGHFGLVVPSSDFSACLPCLCRPEILHFEERPATNSIRILNSVNMEHLRLRFPRCFDFASAPVFRPYSTES